MLPVCCTSLSSLQQQFHQTPGNSRFFFFSVFWGYVENKGTLCRVEWQHPDKRQLFLEVRDLAEGSNSQREMAEETQPRSQHLFFCRLWEGDLSLVKKYKLSNDARRLAEHVLLNSVWRALLWIAWPKGLQRAAFPPARSCPAVCDRRLLPLHPGGCLGGTGQAPGLGLFTLSHTFSLPSGSGSLRT